MYDRVYWFLWGEGPTGRGLLVTHDEYQWRADLCVVSPPLTFDPTPICRDPSTETTTLAGST